MWDSSHTHIHHTINQIGVSQSVVKILPNEADHEKKATFGGTFDFQIIFQGKYKMIRW